MTSPEARTYAQAKSRSATAEADRDLHSSLQMRIDAEHAPLTVEEQDRAKETWRTLRDTMPFMADFIKAMSDLGMVNGRRRLAEMTIKLTTPVQESTTGGVE